MKSEVGQVVEGLGMRSPMVFVYFRGFCGCSLGYLCRGDVTHVFHSGAVADRLPRKSKVARKKIFRSKNINKLNMF